MKHLILRILFMIIINIVDFSNIYENVIISFTIFPVLVSFLMKYNDDKKKKILEKELEQLEFQSDLIQAD